MELIIYMLFFQIYGNMEMSIEMLYGVYLLYLVLAFSFFFILSFICGAKIFSSNTQLKIKSLKFVQLERLKIFWVWIWRRDFTYFYSRRYKAFIFILKTKAKSSHFVLTRIAKIDPRSYYTTIFMPFFPEIIGTLNLKIQGQLDASYSLNYLPSQVNVFLSRRLYIPNINNAFDHLLPAGFQYFHSSISVVLPTAEEFLKFLKNVDSASTHFVSLEYVPHYEKQPEDKNENLNNKLLLAFIWTSIMSVMGLTVKSLLKFVSWGKNLPFP